RLAGAGVPGDHDEVDMRPALDGPALRVVQGGAHPPVLCRWRWMSRARLRGMPGTASSSPRLAPTSRSGEPKCVSSARLRTGPPTRRSARRGRGVDLLRARTE